MSALFIIMMLMIFFFLLAGIRDFWLWIFQKNEVKSVDNWNKFRQVGEENCSGIVQVAENGGEDRS